MPFPKTQLIGSTQGKKCGNSGFQSKNMGYRIEDATDPRVQQSVPNVAFGAGYLAQIPALCP